MRRTNMELFRPIQRMLRVEKAADPIPQLFICGICKDATVNQQFFDCPLPPREKARRGIRGRIFDFVPVERK